MAHIFPGDFEDLRIPFQNLQGRHLISHTLAGETAAIGTNYGPFYISVVPTKIMSISESHSVVGTDGSDVTLQIERLQGVEASGAGDDLLATGFNLKGSADTVVKKQLRDFVTGTQKRFLFLSGTDRLGFVLSGTATAIQDVTVSVELLEI